MKEVITFIVLILILKISHAQTIDSTYRVLANADSSEFSNLAKAKGWNVKYNSISRMLFASSNNLLYSKPLKKDTTIYYLALMISSQDSTNINSILSNREFFQDGNLLYRPWSAINPVTNQMWYRLLIYKKTEGLEGVNIQFYGHPANK